MEPVAQVAAVAGKPAKPPLKARLQALFAEYGSIAIYTYLVMSLLTIAGFSVAIGMGVEPSSATGVLGVIGAGWLAAKATMPIRIPIAIALTPVVARVVRRGKKWEPPAPAAAEEDDDEEDDEAEEDEDE